MKSNKQIAASELLTVVVVTISSVWFNFHDRRLDFAQVKDFLPAITKAICLADGIVMGVTLSIFVIELAYQLHLTDGLLKNELKTLALPFATYSLIFGFVLLMNDMIKITAFQMCSYLMVFIANAYILFSKSRLRRNVQHSDDD
ncbi:MAG: hypothetical protein HON04_18325 [Planctomicrobium sp.]|jgi:hypothetical protein|nr:hypothetical protein [Planctomicrobium sp.]